MLTAAKNSMTTRLYHLLRRWFKWRRKRDKVEGHLRPDFNDLWMHLNSKEVVQNFGTPWL
jgi:hypothetical protein